MTDFIAALPMYDWPEVRDEVDAQWATIREGLRQQGIDAPDRLTRRNADMPAVPEGVRDAAGNLIAPDPATLPPDELHFPTLWRHPKLLFAQTCWGPMEATGLASQVRLVGQPDYSDVVGGARDRYSSAIVMRRGESPDVAPPTDGRSALPLGILRGARFAFNSEDSMSGIVALTRDLEAAGESLAIFAERCPTGSHRASIAAVAEGSADVAAIDCRSWALAKRFDRTAAQLVPAGWTARRKGLPFIAALGVPDYRWPA
ncbi:MAG: PhnD/SsuA/transferrin family substrate-binding protein [Rhizobiaceae bacterium]